MAKFLGVLKEYNNSVVSEFYANISSHEKEKIRDREKAVQLQAAFRMFSARKKYKKLIASVILIQRWMRGHLARHKFGIKIKERCTVKNHKYFDYQARIIQKYFRGYYSRMYIHDYFARDNYLKFIEEKNQHCLNEIQRYNKT